MTKILKLLCKPYNCMRKDDSITEETRVKVRMGTAWGIIISVVGSAIWLTAVLLKQHYDNQRDHARLMSGLEELNMRSAEWVTHRQFEESILYVATELHHGDTNLSYWKELQLREGIRKKLASPKVIP